jgi:hypothetical protein
MNGAGRRQAVLRFMTLAGATVFVARHLELRLSSKPGI